MMIPWWLPWVVAVAFLVIASAAGWVGFLLYHMLQTERTNHVYRRQDWEAQRAHLEDVITAQAQAFGQRTTLRNGTDDP